MIMLSPFVKRTKIKRIIDIETIINSVSKTGLAISVENHSIIGGLGSAIAECQK